MHEELVTFVVLGIILFAVIIGIVVYFTPPLPPVPAPPAPLDPSKPPVPKPFFPPVQPLTPTHKPIQPLHPSKRIPIPIRPPIKSLRPAHPKIEPIRPHPAPLHPRKTASGSDKSAIIPVTSAAATNYLIKRPHATIAPPYIYRLEWSITHPVPLDGTEYTVFIDVIEGGKPATYSLKTTDTVIEINPLWFATTNVQNYILSTRVEFNKDGTTFTYPVRSFTGTLALPYLITDVNSFYSNTSDVPSWWTKLPIFNYVNAWSRIPQRNNVIMRALAISSTNSLASHDTPGFIRSSAKIYQLNGRERIVQFMIPKFDMHSSGTDKEYEETLLAQNNNPSFLIVQPPKDYVISVFPEGPVTLGVDFETDAGIIRVLDSVELLS